MSQTPTSRDVALRAGVSQSTVSYVLSGKRPIADDTRRRVMDAIAALDYHPDSGARALRSRQSRLIGVAYPLRDSYEVGQLTFLQSISRALRAHDYDAMIVMSDSSADELRRVTGTKLCDGLLFVEVAQHDLRAEAAAELGTPSLFFGLPENRSAIVSVDNDFESGGRLAAETIAKAGHQEIAVLHSSAQHAPDLSFAQRFHKGLEVRAAQLDLRLSTYWLGRTFLEAHRAVANALATQGPDLGVVVSSQIAAGDILASLLLHGVTPGRQVSLLAGSGSPKDLPVLDGYHINSVDHRSEETLELSIDRLMQIINRDPSAPRPGDHELTQPALVPGNTVRHSRPARLDGTGAQAE